MLANYKYDPFGRRIEKNINGTITKYLYDNEDIIAEYDAGGNITTKYTHGPGIDEPLSIEKSGKTYYYHADALGSITALTDSTGKKVKTYTYKVYGAIASQTGTLTQPYMFTGREYDAETGLYFYRARYYDPNTGRFISKDPIGFNAGDVNLYRYVFNSPVNYTDPMGEWLGPVAALTTIVVTVEILYITVDCLAKCSKKYPCDDPENPNSSATNTKKCLDTCFPFLKFLGLTSPKGALLKGSGAIGGEIGKAIGEK